MESERAVCPVRRTSRAERHLGPSLPLGGLPALGSPWNFFSSAPCCKQSLPNCCLTWGHHSESGSGVSSLYFLVLPWTVFWAVPALDHDLGL